MPTQIIEVEAETLDEAELILQNQIPQGFAVQSVQIESDGKPKTIQAAADTTQTAWEMAMQQIPSEAMILSRQDLIPPGRQVLQVEADNEQMAKEQVASQIGETRYLKGMRTIAPARKGLLGIGKAAGRYEAEIAQQAVVAITYRSRARISATLDHAIIVEANQLMMSGVRKGNLQVRDLLQRIATGSDEQFNLIPEETLTWLIEKTYLGEEDYSGELTRRLLKANNRNASLWTSLFESNSGYAFSMHEALIQSGIPALDLLLWYLYTPEAVENWNLRAGAQLRFLQLVGSNYFACEPVLQEGIIMALKDMILNWKGQYYYVIPRCCQLLADTGRTELLPVVAMGIQHCDGEYTAMLNANAKDDPGYYAKDPIDEREEWEKFKQKISEAVRAK